MIIQLTEINDYDISAFQNEVTMYNASIAALQDSTDDDLNQGLLDLFRDLNISLPWEGDFDTFMSNNQSSLVIE